MTLGDWADGQSGGTPLSAARLNERDAAIAAAQDAADAAADTAKWGDVAGKPSTFPPAIGTTASTAAAGNHTHTVANVTGLQAALDAKATASDLAALAVRVAALEAASE